MRNLVRIAISEGLFLAMKNFVATGKYASDKHVLELLATGRLRVNTQLDTRCKRTQAVYVRAGFAAALQEFANDTGRAKSRALDMLAMGKLEPLAITPYATIKLSRVVADAVRKLAAMRNTTVEQCVSNILSQGETIEVPEFDPCKGAGPLFVTHDMYEQLAAEAKASHTAVSSVLIDRLCTRSDMVRLSAYKYIKPELLRIAYKEHKTMSSVLRDILTGAAEPLHVRSRPGSSHGTITFVVSADMNDCLVRYAKRCNISVARLIDRIITGRAPHLGAAPDAEISPDTVAEIKPEPETRSDDTQSCTPVARCISASELQSLVDAAVKKALQAAVKELLAKLA